MSPTRSRSVSRTEIRLGVHARTPRIIDRAHAPPQPGRQFVSPTLHHVLDTWSLHR
jgi:hypothetical protein